MPAPKIKYLYFTAVTGRVFPADSGSPLQLYASYSDVPRSDRTPRTLDIPLNTGQRSLGESFAVSLTMPDPLYYFESMVLTISGNDLWVPKALNFWAEDETGYLYSVVEYLNWPQDRKDMTWSTDSNEGFAEIQIFPLMLSG